MSDYIKGFIYGKMLARNPELMRYAMKQQELEREQSQAKDLGSVLLEALGSDPTDSAPPMPEQAAPQPMPPEAQQPASYTGKYADLINLASQKYSFSPNEIADTIRVESGFNPNARSPTGPLGLMQLSKAAAQDVGLNPDDRLDPAKNIMAGTAYAKQLKDEFGDRWRLAYHDGPTAVRNGEVSKAGLDYVSKFNDTQSGIEQPNSLSPKQYQGGSKFMPSGVTGGEGVLGQDMDPVRRSYLHTIRKLAESDNPLAVQMAAQLYEHMQEAHMQDIQRTALAKDIALTNEVPGTPDYDAFVKRAILKPSQQTNINMGTNNRPIILTPDEQMTYVGKVAKEGEPQPRWTKDGDIKVGAPVGITEDQAKASQYATGVDSALSTIYDIANSKDFSPSLNNKDFIGSELEKTGLPVVSAYGTAMQSETQQTYSQAKREAETHLIHALSGSGFTEKEEQIKTLAYLPDWGDKQQVVRAKQHALAAQLDALVSRAGPAARPELRAAAELAKRKVESIPNNTKKEPQNTINLPELPEGFRWED